MISWFGVHVTGKGKNRDFAENQATSDCFLQG